MCTRWKWPGWPSFAGQPRSARYRRTRAAVVRDRHGAEGVPILDEQGRELLRVLFPEHGELEVDPARTAEGAMLEGILTGAAMESLQDLFTVPERRGTIGVSMR